jgi:hypothetical protein
MSTNNLFYHEEHEEHEGLEGGGCFYLNAFIETPHEIKLFNPCLNNLTLKLIRNPCWIFASFIYVKSYHLTLYVIGVYFCYMVIIETSIFTKRIIEVMPDDSYRELQNTLIAYPKTGKIIRGSGGIRKVRWGLGGQGKQGGVRVIYYRAVSTNPIFMLIGLCKK